MATDSLQTPTRQLPVPYDVAGLLGLDVLQRVGMLVVAFGESSAALLSSGKEREEGRAHSLTITDVTA